jgi:hypothetical protein
MLQQRACPSCGRIQSLNMGAGGHFCLNCRQQWRETAAPEPDTSTSFTDAELERLAIYRRAVAAGFFTDWT